MATAVDSTGLTTSGLIQFKDLSDICNYYRQWFSVTYPLPDMDAKVTLLDWQALAAAVVSGGGLEWIIHVPNITDGLVTNTFWPAPIENMIERKFDYLPVGTTLLTVPPKCTQLVFDVIIGSGGPGCGAFDGASYGDHHHSNSGNGATSGGLIPPCRFDVAPGDILKVVVADPCGGYGPNGPNRGGGGWYYRGSQDTTIYLNDNQIAVARCGLPNQGGYFPDGRQSGSFRRSQPAPYVKDQNIVYSETCSAGEGQYVSNRGGWGANMTYGGVTYGTGGSGGNMGPDWISCQGGHGQGYGAGGGGGAMWWVGPVTGGGGTAAPCTAKGCFLNDKGARYFYPNLFT